MAVIYECDRCGRQTKIEGGLTQVTIPGDRNVNTTPTVIHICDNCCAALRRWVVKVVRDESPAP